MTFDYVWSNGKIDIASPSEAVVRGFHKQSGYLGKVWRREYADDGLLEGISDITMSGPVCHQFGTLAECREPSECTRHEYGFILQDNNS